MKDFSSPAAAGTDGAGRDAAGEVELIQVCADASDQATSARELRALVAAGALHPKARKRLLTLTRDGAPAVAPAGVTVQPIYEWMLGEAKSSRY